MNIKDILDQEKQRDLKAKVKSKQEKHIRKLFFKDCYKMWKEYMKVEKPYTWWLYLITLDNLITSHSFLFWIKHDAPSSYVEGSWFDKKWSVLWCLESCNHKIKLKTNPNNDYIYLT